MSMIADWDRLYEAVERLEKQLDRIEQRVAALDAAGRRESQESNNPVTSIGDVLEYLAQREKQESTNPPTRRCPTCGDAMCRSLAPGPDSWGPCPQESTNPPDQAERLREAMKDDHPDDCKGCPDCQGIKNAGPLT